MVRIMNIEQIQEHSAYNQYCHNSHFSLCLSFSLSIHAQSTPTPTPTSTLTLPVGVRGDIDDGFGKDHRACLHQVPLHATHETHEAMCIQGHAFYGVQVSPGALRSGQLVRLFMPLHILTLDTERVVTNILCYGAAMIIATDTVEIIR